MKPNPYRARRCFHSHKFNAKKRNIPFELTFDEWYNWWLSNGVDKSLPSVSRNTQDELCMCRKQDLGPYSIDNIYCDTRENNARDWHTF
jgi:hypothetical protein